MDKKLVWERPDGGVSITHLDVRDKLSGESDDDFIIRYSEKLKLSPQFSSSVLSVVDGDKIPSDRSNRNEWSLKGGKVEVDPIKVKAKKDKEDEQLAVYSKMGVTKEEFLKIRGN